MNNAQLRLLVDNAIKTSEADVIIALHNDQLGTIIVPYWNYGKAFDTPQKMEAELIEATAGMALEYADHTMSGDTIGVFAMSWDILL